MANTIEEGDIYFFYRPRVDADKVRNLDDVQRLYLILVPDAVDTARLLLVGKKRMPEIVKDEPKSTTREWMINDLTGKPEKVGEALAPLEYETRTRGEREQGEAIPVAEGRYAILARNDSSRLAYRLTSPEKPHEAQTELGILAEASYVISVRNPAIDVPGFPDAKPDYPKSLQEKFAEKRWIDIDDSRLLDYEDAQLLLIGANDDLSEEGISITGKAALFKTLGLNEQEWPTEALGAGKLTEPRMKPESREPEGDFSKGGERGGRKARQTDSASGIAMALKGVDFPCRKADLVKQAKANDASKEIVEVLNELPGEQYETMADIQKAFGDVR
ncbi:DUF2795 domain-containing protein [Halomonas daqiaonensis]|uniref:DUF2795 domain-containing protein n=1 Tax=Halomonas daqiaonensis TaxID=650850 RepID=A0A1H7VGV6_9GAMM|nr:DUF2795 domain-containing protein [Halomonas daqiaonensis]SEM08115.1 Protein of unknown function [Halomonas daqiaonensis]